MMTIRYQDDGVTAHVDDPDATILAVSIASKIPHFRECGGQARCTTCRVRILDGINHVSERSAPEARIAEARGWDRFTRLACQTRVSGNVCVRRLVRSAADLSLFQVEALRSEPGREMPVAILVCDIRQFTPFVDAHLPYDVFHILNRFFGEIGEPILLNDGFIYQYVGDQIVGLFGIKGASPAQSCLNAVRAGLGMISSLRALNDEIEEEFGVRLGIRIGAHFGSLVVGYLGHPTWPQFAVVGDAMNVASRIEGANKDLGTTFLVSDALYDQLPISVLEGRRTRVPLKGKDGLHTLIEVLDFAEFDAERLVQDTARRLLADQDGFAAAFYGRLFEVAPELRRLFSGDMEAQGRMLTQVLELAVYGLSRFHEIAIGLAALGRSHVGYGVTAEHYLGFRQVFLDTVGEILGEAFDTEVEKAWGEAIDQIIDAMCTGALLKEKRPALQHA